MSGKSQERYEKGRKIPLAKVQENERYSYFILFFV